MSLNDEYYVLGGVSGGEYASLTITKGSEQEDADGYIDDAEPMEYIVSKHSTGKMGDYHPTTDSVVSAKVAEALDVEGVQLIPATITDKKKKAHEGYFYVNVYNIIPALDMDASVHNYDDFLEVISMFQKIVFKEEVLAAVPPEKRLAFRFPEASGYLFFHQSVADKVLALNPEGLSLHRVSEWGKGKYWE